MMLCQHCQEQMDDGAVFCDYCGHELNPETLRSKQTPMPQGGAKLTETPVATPAEPRAGIVPSVIVLQLTTGQRFALQGQSDYIVGRVGVDRVRPDVDLADWYGFEGGVSRAHIAIHVRQEGVFVEDLNSRNETVHNGYRLMPGQWYPLGDGDVLRLGAITLHVTFQ